jgi:PmbA protein
MEDILSQASRSVDAAEAFIVTSENTPIQFETNRLKHAQTHQSTSVALRVIKYGRIGYATGTRLDDVAPLVRAAAETAAFGAAARFDFPAPGRYPAVATTDPLTDAVPFDTMVHLGEDLIARLRSHTPALICHAGIGKGSSTIRILSTRGTDVTYRRTYFSVSVSGELIRGTDMLFVGEGESSCRPVLEAGRLADMVIRQLEWARTTATITTGSLPVVFTPSGVASALVSPLMAAFNAKIVLEGASPIARRLGEAVFNSSFSLYDDPTLPFRPASRPFDDEGVPSQRTPLVENGVVKNFLYDLQTAAQAGGCSTGNAGRGRGLPAPSPSSFVISPGTVGFDEMLGAIRNGLVVEDLMGAEQGNILGGDFSGNVLLGYKVENGRIAGRVKNTMVSGNIYQLLNQTVAIGSDTRWVGGGLSTPSLFFPNVSVASK